MSYTDVVEVAKLIRKELKNKFPGTKFSVRASRFSLGESISVRWTDFPTVKQVENHIKQYEHIRRDPISGDILGGGNRYLSCNNVWSDEIRKEIAEIIPNEVEVSDIGYKWNFDQAAEHVYEKYRKEVETPKKRKRKKKQSAQEIEHQ
jgi:hypothetical protein